MVSSFKYELEVVSLLKGSEQRVFQRHSVNGVETIGVDKGEPFFVRFKNNTNERVQVRLALDGTDVLSGTEALLTDKEGQFWMVGANSVLEVKAWPESNSGGSGFIFGEPGKGVAANTHKNTKNVGLISASVFVEGYAKYEPLDNTSKYKPETIFLGGFGGGGAAAGGGTGMAADYYVFNSDLAGASGGGTLTGAGAGAGAGNASFGSGVIRTSSLGGGVSSSKREEKIAVGAREFISQALSEVPSFSNPVYDETLTVNYEHWDTLVAKLNKAKRVNLQNVPKQLEFQYPRSRWMSDSKQYRF